MENGVLDVHNQMYHLRSFLFLTFQNRITGHNLHSPHSLIAWASGIFSYYIAFPKKLINKAHVELFKGEFPGGTVVKNLPANARDMGSSPGPGRSHMPRSNEAHAPQLLSLCSRPREPQLPSPRAAATEVHEPKARAPQQERPR